MIENKLCPCGCGETFTFDDEWQVLILNPDHKCGLCNKLLDPLKDQYFKPQWQDSEKTLTMLLCISCSKEMEKEMQKIRPDFKFE